MFHEIQSEGCFQKDFWKNDRSHVGIAELRWKQRPKATRLGTEQTGFDLGSAASLVRVSLGEWYSLSASMLPSAEWM